MSAIEMGDKSEARGWQKKDPLPESVQGNNYILAIIDFKTRYVQVISMPNQKAETIAKTLLENWILLYEVTAIVLTDQASNFESKLVHEICNLFGINKRKPLRTISKAMVYVSDNEHV